MDRAGGPEKDLVLETLQIGVTETAEETRISGVLPIEVLSFLADDFPQECSDFKTYPGVPFGRAFHSTK